MSRVVIHSPMLPPAPQAAERIFPCHHNRFLPMSPADVRPGLEYLGALRHGDAYGPSSFGIAIIARLSIWAFESPLSRSRLAMRFTRLGTPPRLYGYGTWTAWCPLYGGQKAPPGRPLFPQSGRSPPDEPPPSTPARCGLFRTAPHSSARNLAARFYYDWPMPCLHPQDSGPTTHYGMGERPLTELAQLIGRGAHRPNYRHTGHLLLCNTLADSGGGRQSGLQREGGSRQGRLPAGVHATDERAGPRNRAPAGSKAKNPAHAAKSPCLAP